jgi:hypothetical protein
MEFGWWQNNPAQGKFQVLVTVHGGNITWQRKQGHHTSWVDHTPDDVDRERLILEAQRRVPRRLISTQQFEEIKRLSENTGPGKISGRRITGSGPSLDKRSSGPR